MVYLDVVQGLSTKHQILFEKGEFIMDYQEMLLTLIAFCQREGILSSNGDVVLELSDLFGCEESDIEDLLN